MWLFHQSVCKSTSEINDKYFFYWSKIFTQYVIMTFYAIFTNVKCQYFGSLRFSYMVNLLKYVPKTKFPTDKCFIHRGIRYGLSWTTLTSHKKFLFQSTQHHFFHKFNIDSLASSPHGKKTNMSEMGNTHDWNNDKPYECGLETSEGW